MNTLIVFAVVIAAAAAGPIGGEIVSVHQDTLGNYKYSVDGLHARSSVEQYNVPVAVAVESHPVVRKIVEAPVVAIAKTEHVPIIRKVEVVETPVVKSAVVHAVPVAATHFIRVAVPESPEVLDFESRQFAAHVAHQYHHYI